MEYVILAILLAVAAGYGCLQLRAARDWDGLYGFAGKAPIAGWILWLALMMADMTRDPASHTLWPFEIVIGMMLSSFYLLALSCIRRIANEP